MRLLKINKIYSMFIPPGTSLLNANVYFINDEIKTIIDTGIPFTLTLDRLKHIFYKNILIVKSLHMLIVFLFFLKRTDPLIIRILNIWNSLKPHFHF
ncbi:MAG: hypothetical protein ACTSRP_12810 [Candidatus Helarchaeota archaeon]